MQLVAPMTEEAVQELRAWEAAEQDPADIEALRREAYGSAGGDDLGKVGPGVGEGGAGKGLGQGSTRYGSPASRTDGGFSDLRPTQGWRGVGEKLVGQRRVGEGLMAAHDTR